MKHVDRDTRVQEIYSQSEFQKRESVTYFCFDFGHFPEIVQFILLTTLLMVFFLAYGYMQEWIFAVRGMKNHSWWVVNSWFNLFSLIQSYIQVRHFGTIRILLSPVVFRDGLEWKLKKDPVKDLRFISTLSAYHNGFLSCQSRLPKLSNSSCIQVNSIHESPKSVKKSRTCSVIYRCCKLIPVLIGGIAIQGKRYGPLDFAAAFLMSVGLVFFTLADSQLSTNFDFIGVIMISIALVADAILGNMQEKTLKEFHAHNAEVIFYTYFIGTLYLAICLLYSGHFLPGVEYFLENKKDRFGTSLIFSVSGYFGMQIILTFIRRFGAFITVTVTSFRKVISIVISFLAFSKPFTMAYVYSGSLVLTGIYLNLLSKRYRHWSLYATFVMAAKNFKNGLCRFKSSHQDVSDI